jgi:hypothetical protein
VGVLLVVAAVGGAAAAAWQERRSVGPALGRIGGWPMAAAVGLALAALAATAQSWRAVAGGLGVPLGRWEAARIWFVTQLGKYIPGSVWPIVMQMEAGRARGAGRARMVAANLIATAVTCTVGLVVAGGVLPFADRGALERYWWGLPLGVALLVTLHPGLQSAAVGRLSRRLGRPSPPAGLGWASELRAAGWTAGFFAGTGAQTAVLAGAAAGWRPAVLAVAFGATALAVPLGILFLPAPAGAGVREVVLVFVLRSVMPTGDALATVIVARLSSVAADLAAAAIASPRGRSGGVRARGLEPPPLSGPGPKPGASATFATPASSADQHFYPSGPPPQGYQRVDLQTICKPNWG